MPEKKMSRRCSRFRCAERKDYICCADCERRSLCLAARRNDPARCGLENRRPRTAESCPLEPSSGTAAYFLARDRWLKADKKAAAAIRADDEKLAREWTGVQGTYFRQARQCAESMGLSVTSRCRIVVPAAVVNAASAPEEGDEFTRRLRARQDAAMEKAGG